VLKTSWPCVSCGGSGHNATLRGRTRCLQCDGIGIDLLSVAVELVRRSNDRTALIASIERAEATCARLAATQQHHADHGHEACACHSFMTEVSTVIGDVTAAISSREVDEA
jgi:heme exporter protein D